MFYANGATYFHLYFYSIIFEMSSMKIPFSIRGLLGKSRILQTGKAYAAPLLRPYHIPALARLESYIQNLSSGDRLIAYACGSLVAATGFISIFALEQTFLVQTPASGGTLTEGILGSPRFINPILAITDADRDLAALTYAGLLGKAVDGTLRPVLAEGYEVSPDGKEYTVTIRNDAVFSDGTSVTAQDIVFTVLKAQDQSLKSSVYADWAGIEAEAVNTRTVRFTLAKQNVLFPNNLTLGILPARLWGGITNEEFPFSTLQTEPVGAGPYTFSRMKRDESGRILSYQLASNPQYVLGEPYIRRVRFIFFPRLEDLSAALRAGDIESAYGVATPDAIRAPYARIFGVFFNPNQEQLFLHEEVRKALSLAVDRNALVEGPLGGYATPIMGPVPPHTGIQETPVPTGEQATKSAADALTGAGWDYDAELRAWKNDNRTLGPVTIKTSNVPELKAIATAVKRDWERLGVATDVELYESGDLNKNVIRPRKYGALLFGMVIGGDHDLYAFWHSGERNDPGLNIALYANKTVDSLLENARAESSREKRLAIIQKLNDIIAKEYPAVFIESPDFAYTLPEEMGGVVLPQITTPTDRFIGIEQWYRRTENVWPVFAGTGAMRKR